MNNNIRVLSGSALKVIAIIAMIIDHIGAFILSDVEFGSICLVTLFGTAITPYAISRAIGRISFPIFAFLISEGFIHTSNRKKYAISLAIFAVISEIPWDLLANGSVIYLKSNNIIFTLLLGYLGIWVLNSFETAKLKQIVLLIILFVASALLCVDYGCIGFSVIILTYMLRQQKLFQALICSYLLAKPWFCVLAFVPINMYNGTRGFIRTKTAKYIFYSVYPLHLIAIYLFKQCI